MCIIYKHAPKWENTTQYRHYITDETNQYRNMSQSRQTMSVSWRHLKVMNIWTCWLLPQFVTVKCQNIPKPLTFELIIQPHWQIADLNNDMSHNSTLWLSSLTTSARCSGALLFWSSPTLRSDAASLQNNRKHSTTASTYASQWKGRQCCQWSSGYSHEEQKDMWDKGDVRLEKNDSL